MAQLHALDQIIFVFNARDERDPHRFIMADPLYMQGIVKHYSIDELDVIHKERDDELTITGKELWVFLKGYEAYLKERVRYQEN